MRTYNDFANAIRRRRKEKELTLLELSKQVGLSVPYISELERGNKQPPLGPHLHELAAALDLDEGELTRLATSARRRVEIDVQGAAPAKVQLAGLLARRAEDGGVTDAEAGEIIRMIDERRGGGSNE